MKTGKTEFQCPRCTILNHTENDECYICGAPLKEGQRKEPKHATNSKTSNKTVLETIWGYFVLIMYTTYTVAVTWTSETIIKIIAYFVLLLALYVSYCITPCVIKLLLRQLIKALKYVKKMLITLFRNIADVRTNPLIWVLITVLTAWCLRNTMGININKFNINTLKERISTIEIDVNNLKLSVKAISERVTNIEFGLKDLKSTVENGLEALGNNMKQMDDRMTWITTKMNDTYTPWIEKGGWVESTDTFVRETMYSIFSKLSSKPITRREFGLGCFMKGTKIQIDAKGDVTRVEELRNGDYVFSPILNELIKIKILFAYGYETGNMYQIITGDALNVTVTETHPMKICHVVNDRFDCNNNVAAKAVYEGNWTQTINGYQRIVSVVQIPIENALVYNFMLDVADDVVIPFRAVIANGIYTLDLAAQQQHH